MILKQQFKNLAIGEGYILWISLIAILMLFPCNAYSNESESLPETTSGEIFPGGRIHLDLGVNYGISFPINNFLFQKKPGYSHVVGSYIDMRILNNISVGFNVEYNFSFSKSVTFSPESSFLKQPNIDGYHGYEYGVKILKLMPTVKYYPIYKRFKLGLIFGLGDEIIHTYYTQFYYNKPDSTATDTAGSSAFVITGGLIFGYRIYDNLNVSFMFCYNFLYTHYQYSDTFDFKGTTEYLTLYPGFLYSF